MSEIFKTTRRDLLMVDPRNVIVEEGFNSRRDFALDELIPSIVEHGVMSPITVVVTKDDAGEEKYRLVDGERRLRATLAAIEQGAEIARIPAMKLTNVIDKSELVIQQLVRNEGKRFTDYENAIAFNTLHEKFGFTVTEIAQKVYGKASQAAYVSQCLSLLTMPEQIQNELANNTISASAVREVVTHVETPSEQVAAVAEAVENAKTKGKKKATAKDVTNTSVNDKRDSATICKGLELLFKYTEMYDDRPTKDVDLLDIYNALKNGKTITEFFNEVVTVPVMVDATSAVE